MSMEDRRFKHSVLSTHSWRLLSHDLVAGICLYNLNLARADSQMCGKYVATVFNFNEAATSDILQSAVLKAGRFSM
jgi:hypothetical protein